VSGLTDFQAEVTRLFFSLPASNGFLLAGGGALLASGLTTRPTQDLDFFGDARTVDISSTRDQFEAAAAEHGWQCTRIQDSDTFVRLRVSGDDEVIVDLAIDAPPGRPSVVTIVGPTFDPEELAGRTKPTSTTEELLPSLGRRTRPHHGLLARGVAALP